MYNLVIFILLYYLLINVIHCVYPPIGDEVQAGSVLLPASRRGRYLANIARRQAVDGTGVHFNKDADRMNADAKKKVDVLSEELLPYIIAEQERRSTLYKRVMTAIQNGEKGVTIAEIRNKPPAIIRKGLLYRCPTNRPPKEPDGSGVIMCEDGIEPSPIMYDSCLNAEDKELFIADNKYFFCNRHKIEGPDLPRNGSTVIACSPTERTSLNYTSLKCALEDTADVVVHYRYYPDRTYKFVTELDPDREMCDHWSPCQIGYIYSLPSPDTATSANEIWRDYEEKFEDVEKDEIIAPIPEDSIIEFVSVDDIYTTSHRKIPIPEGFIYNGTGKYLTDDGEKLKRYCIVPKDNINITECYPENIEATHTYYGTRYVRVGLKFTPLKPDDVGSYYLRFEPLQKAKNKAIQFIKFLTLNTGLTKLIVANLVMMPGQHSNTTNIPYRCTKCIVRGVTLRADDGSIQNLDHTQYRVKKYNDEKGKEQSYLEIDLKELRPRDFGDYFVIIQNEDNGEERIKALTVTAPEKDGGNLIQVQPLTISAAAGEHFDKTMVYACEACELSDILCNGDSVLPGGRVTNIMNAKTINYNFPSFEDSHSCVYMGVFKIEEKFYQKILAIIDNSSPLVTIPKVPAVKSPSPGDPFQEEIAYTCQGCTVDSVHVDGIHLQAVNARRNFEISVAYFAVTASALTVIIPYFDPVYEGAYQATFVVGEENITKAIMKVSVPTIGPEYTDGCAKNDGTPEAPAAAAGADTAPAGDAAADGAGPADGSATGDGAAPAEGETPPP